MVFNIKIDPVLDKFLFQHGGKDLIEEFKVNVETACYAGNWPKELTRNCGSIVSSFRFKDLGERAEYWRKLSADFEAIRRDPTLTLARG